MGDAGVVFLGEIHDNPFQHANQASAVAALEPKALVFEMLTPAQALKVTPALRRYSDQLGEVLGWRESGWPDFSMYYPIFAAAPEAEIFGGGVPPEEARRAVTDGAAKVFGTAALLFGLDRPLPQNEETTREAGQMQAHCDALPETLLPGMVQAQRLRDAAIARGVIAAWEETGGPVAVITGNGHARTDWGAPSLLQALDGVKVLSLGQYEDEAPADPPYDFWLITLPAEREDPCDAFR